MALEHVPVEPNDVTPMCRGTMLVGPVDVGIRVDGGEHVRIDGRVRPQRMPQPKSESEISPFPTNAPQSDAWLPSTCRSSKCTFAFARRSIGALAISTKKRLILTTFFRKQNGFDHKDGTVVTPPANELANWWPQVRRRFDDDVAPSMRDVVV